MQQASHRSRFSAAVAAGLLASALIAAPTLGAEQAKPIPVTPSSIPVGELQPGPGILPVDLLPPLEPGQSKAARWLKLLDQASVGEFWQQPIACRRQPARERTGMCRLQWRNTRGLSAWRGRYQEYSFELTRRFAGEHLANHLEFDIDRTPELRLRYEFE